ncbi:hypothetical protein DVH24_034820 [Malus domestica]|uniref:Uncharacterized protein n=1 Tax=Malus domestica TaxID=3750 RepID=A0A498IEH6_MALDO|nr:hypothetical protein DVH24_034820 [Malus domestica]
MKTETQPVQRRDCHMKRRNRNLAIGDVKGAFGTQTGRDRTGRDGTGQNWTGWDGTELDGTGRNEDVEQTRSGGKRDAKTPKICHVEQPVPPIFSAPNAGRNASSRSVPSHVPNAPLRHNS